MHNNTLKNYKKAIINKYNIEKEGQHFDYLYKPSRGKLRDFCWMIFEDNPTPDDLNVFRNLFSMDFEPTKKNKFKEKKDKFRPIETFFKGETDLTNIDAINMAAILVDFQPRPFKKFRTLEIEQVESAVKAKVKTKAKTFEIEVFAKDKKEKSGKKMKSKSLFANFKNLFTKKTEQKMYSGKMITNLSG